MKSNQISKTAAFIAIKFYGLTQKEDLGSLFDKDVIRFYQKLVKSLPFPLGSYYKLLKKSWIRHFFIFWEELLLPGDLMHIIMRKLYLQKMIKEMKSCGYTQLLVIGAGFDHLATCFSHEDIYAVELDAPRMAAIKKDFVVQQHYENSNLHIVEAYFSQDTILGILKRQTNLDPTRKTMIVAEGFFDYFDECSASEIIQDIKHFFEGPITLFSTIFSLQELSWFRSFVYTYSIRLAGEKLKLNMDKSQYCHFLKHCGFDIDKCISYREMEQTVLKPGPISMPVLEGFYLIKAHYGRGSE